MKPWEPKELTVHERQLFDELMESIKDGNLSADEREKITKEMSKILFDPERDYFTGLIIDYKEAYNRWQNKQGAPTSYFYGVVCTQLDWLESCLIQAERIAEEERKLDPNFDNTMNNPEIAECSHIRDAIRYLQGIEGELKNAMGQQEQSAEPQAPETDEKMTAYLKAEGYIVEKKSKNGKYDLSDNAENTIHRFVYNNYQKYEDWKFLIAYLDKHTNHNCTIETLKRYIRDYKKIVPIQLKNQETFESLQKSI